MAEAKKIEKKGEKTTKEEVEIEKRFCTKCGKELTGDEVCSCEKEPEKEEIISVNKEAMKSYGKKFIDTIIGMFKNPKTTIEEEVEQKDTTSNIIMLLSISITFGLYVIGICQTTFSSLGTLNNVINIPYFKIFLYGVLIYFILSFVPILAAFILARIIGNQKFDFKKSLSLYSTSMTPMIISNLIMAVLYYLNILTLIGAIIGIIISLLCFFHYILGYLDFVTVHKDKKAYLLTGLVSLWVIIDLIVIVILVANVGSDLSKEYNLNKYNDNSIFNWD